MLSSLSTQAVLTKSEVSFFFVRSKCESRLKLGAGHPKGRGILFTNYTSAVRGEVVVLMCVCVCGGWAEGREKDETENREMKRS